MTAKLVFLFAGILVINQSMLAQVEGPGEDKTLSPYFYIPSEDQGNETLPLKSTSAEVNIAGVIADVTVTQEYKNEGKKPIEAIYVFPASIRAAVYSMVMTIGERVVMARIEEKGKARQDYEEAKNNGQSASLLEQERPNVFSMNVANIMPGDLIRVELKYTEALIPENGIYQFIYPTVVGPRYSSGDGLASAGEGWNANPYTHSGVKPLYVFDIYVRVNAGMPLKDLRCPSHQTVVAYTDRSTAAVDLAASEISGGNRDFILQYRLAGHQIETGVLTFQGEKENYFLAMIQPPDRVEPDMIPPREYIFIVDVSGSMYGFPIETSKKLMKDLIGGLKPSDRFNVILFAGGSATFAVRSVAATPEHVRSAISFIEKENGGGGTELLPALNTALSMKSEEGFSRTFIIATDGYVTVEKEALELVRTSLGEANFFAFGIGSGVNRYLIEGLAHAGQGEPFMVTGPEEAAATAERFREYVSSPVLTDITVTFDGFEAYDLAQESFPDIFSERPVILFGKYRGTPRGGIILTGSNGDGKVSKRIDLASARSDAANSGLMYLWARERIRQLDDLESLGYGTQEIESEVTRLGLEYNLLTSYTSFIAIDTESRNREGSGTTVRQPLPLPEGVSNYAVGGCMSGLGSKKHTRGDAAAAPPTTAREESLDETGNDVFPEKENITAPQFNGGQKALDTFIKANIVYPEKSRLNGVTGKVIAEFYVEADGSISGIQILYSLDSYTDAEVIRVIKLMAGKWKPGEAGGQPVKARVVLSGIEFRP